MWSQSYQEGLDGSRTVEQHPDRLIALTQPINSLVGRCGSEAFQYGDRGGLQPQTLADSDTGSSRLLVQIQAAEVRQEEENGQKHRKVALRKSQIYKY